MQPFKDQLRQISMDLKIATMASVNFLNNRPTPRRVIAALSDIHQLS
jgi:hypothetical protein